jgi:HlyD family secretion protein
MFVRIWHSLWWNPLRRLGVLILAIIFVVSATVGGIVFLIRQASAAAIPVYLTRAASFGDLAVTISASGTLVSARTYNLSFRSAGQLATLNVQVGQQVQAGQTLASLDTTQLRDAVSQAQTQVSNAQAIYSASQTIANAQQNLYNATVNDAPYSCDTDDNPVRVDQSCTAKAQAQAQVAVTQAQQQLAQAQASLNAALAALKTAQDNLAAATLIAPAAGTVAAINGSVGEYLTPPSPQTGTSVAPFLVLTDLSALEIAARVSTADMASIQVGQPVRFTVPSVPGQIFSGAVNSFSPISQDGSYSVQITVNEQSLGGARLLPGMAAALRIAVIQRQQVLLVSNDALRYAHTLPPTTAAQLAATNRRLNSHSLFSQAGAATPVATFRGAVFIVQQGTLVKRSLVLGVTNGADTEVISGLAPGDATVVGMTNGAFVFRPGALKHGVQSRSVGTS